jgi:hypothetical protein
MTGPGSGNPSKASPRGSSRHAIPPEAPHGPWALFATDPDGLHQAATSLKPLHGTVSCEDYLKLLRVAGEARTECERAESR